MLYKDTFRSDEELNIFFRLHSIGGETQVFIVKFMVIYNPDIRAQEYHVLFTSEKILASGQHFRKGVTQ